MKSWVSKSSGYTPLMESPVIRGKKLIDLNPNTVVEVLDSVITNSEVNGFTHCKYVLDDKRQYIGWVENKYLDPYFENYPKDIVDVSDIQTSNPSDAAQYINWNGVKQYNMCGELCVCSSLEIDKLSDFLKTWQVKSPPFWKRVFGSGLARGTGESELVEMYSLYDVKSQTLQGKYPQYTPELLNDLMGAIVGVRMNSSNGRLNGGGVGHWVLIEDVIQERSGYGTVTIYNPFPNRIEIYSYAEFLTSARVPYGAIKI